MTAADTTPTRCLAPRCGRILTSTKSVARKYGPRCWTRVLAAAKVVDVSHFKDPAPVLAKAIELIEQGGIVRTRHDGQYLANSFDGLNTYLVETVGERSCTCKAGTRLGRCNHLVAVNILNASAVRRTATHVLAA
jgi:hypothetical protein